MKNALRFIWDTIRIMLVFSLFLILCYLVPYLIAYGYYKGKVTSIYLYEESAQ